MSDFQVPIVKLTISPHPNADRLEVAHVGGYQCIVGKGDFVTGDTAVYIPEAAIVPEAVLEKMHLAGKLSGPQKNRVKAMKLRGILSQGLICSMDIVRPWRHGAFDVGDCCAQILGITKYEPVIPASMAGNVWNAGMNRTIRYDVENIKKYNRVLKDGEPVVITEKLHGTWCMVASMPYELADKDQGAVIVSSKGQAAKGLAIKKPAAGKPQTSGQKLLEKWYKFRQSCVLPFHKFKINWLGFVWLNNETSDRALTQKMSYLAQRIKACHNPGVNENNIYWRAYKESGVTPGVLARDWFKTAPIFVLGEVFGAGVQDLDYGSTSTKPGFRVFDVYIGIPGQGRYLNDAELDKACKMLIIDRVPVLYRGPFSQAKVDEFTSGKETVTGEDKHIREGIVIRPVVERRDDSCGRVQLKSVSENYIMRKNGTEFN